MSAAGAQLPVVEILPAFEEEREVRFAPGAVAQAMLADPSSAAGHCRMLGATLLALGRDRRLRRIGLIGSRRGEGATTVSLGLVQALAREPGRRVLLLELDLRHPALDRALGLGPSSPGLLDFLTGETEVPLLRRRGEGFWVLSAGRASAAEPTAFAARLASLLRAADRVFDYVVVDCPPVLDGGLALHDHLDGYVLVVRARRASRQTIRRAFEGFRSGTLIGTVLNGARLPAF